MRFGKLIIILAMALAVFQVQCFMSCPAFASSNSPGNLNVPPCHRHHNSPQAPAPCSHEAVSAAKVSSILKHDLGPSASTGDLGLATPSLEPFAFVFEDHPLEGSTSPPTLVRPASSSVLRV